MIVVAVDGEEVKPVEVDEIWVYVAQRYDVIVRARMPVDNYWIRGRTFAESDGFVGQVMAVLRYAGAPDVLPRRAATKGLGCSPTIAPWRRRPERPPPATQSFSISVICLRERWACLVNGTAFEMPHRPALLSSYEGKDPSMGNPRTHWVRVARGAVVDIVVNNVGTQQHPMHLHGDHFWMLGMGHGVYDPERDSGSLNTRDPVKRDTVQVREKSWAVFRIAADNPGCGRCIATSNGTLLTRCCSL